MITITQYVIMKLAYLLFHHLSRSIHFKIHVVKVLCNSFLQGSGEANEPKGKAKKPLTAKTVHSIFLESAQNRKVRAKECRKSYL